MRLSDNKPIAADSADGVRSRDIRLQPKAGSRDIVHCAAGPHGLQDALGVQGVQSGAIHWRKLQVRPL